MFKGCQLLQAKHINISPQVYDEPLKHQLLLVLSVCYLLYSLLPASLNILLVVLMSFF